MSTVNPANQYDRRQYELMFDRLKAFTRAAISLRKLIEDLRGLVEVLEHPDPAWKEDFLSNWWSLEQVFAVAIDREELDPLPAESQELVDDAVCTLRRMVVEALGSVPQGLDTDS